jgi:hypothetical protein
MPTIPFAPFTQLLMRLGPNSLWVPTGFLEENSKIDLTTITVGVDTDTRFVCHKQIITGIDAEGLADNAPRFLALQNRVVEAAVYCYAAGGFILGNARYHVAQEHVPTRGMRYVHTLTGKSYWPGWITFFEKASKSKTKSAWKNFLHDIDGTNHPVKLPIDGGIIE